VGNGERHDPVRSHPPLGRDRAEGQREMIAFLRTVLYGCCMVIALMCGMAALTITVAIVTKKLSDPQAWMAVVFFTLVGGIAWIAGRSARWNGSSLD